VTTCSTYCPKLPQSELDAPWQPEELEGELEESITELEKVETKLEEVEKKLEKAQKGYKRVKEREKKRSEITQAPTAFTTVSPVPTASAEPAVAAPAVAAVPKTEKQRRRLLAWRAKKEQMALNAERTAEAAENTQPQPPPPPPPPPPPVSIVLPQRKKRKVPVLPDVANAFDLG